MATIKPRLLATTIFLLSLAGTFLAAEFGYRAYLTATFSRAEFAASFVPRFFAVDDSGTRAADDGLYFPNLDIPYRHFSAAHDLSFQSRIRTNNLGYRAERDWTLDKPAGEFRIAVLGDSMTAALMSDRAWTDVAENALNADLALLAHLGVQYISVLNFGVVGAGFDTMAQVEADHARRFAPDMTVLHFITPDILRPDLNIIPTGPAEPAPRTYRGIVDISTERTAAETIVDCDRPVIGLGVAGCRPSILIRVEDDAVFDKAVMREVKLSLSRHFLWGSLWRSTFPYSVAAALGEPFQLRAQGLFDILDLIVAKAQAAEGPEQAVRRSAATLARLKARVGRLLVVHGPTVTEIHAGAVRAGLADSLRRASGIDIRFMGESPRLAGATASEIDSWFNLPSDSHFSTRGVDIYGLAFAELMAAELRAGAGR